MAYTPIKTNDLEDVKLSYTTKQTFDILNNNFSELDDRADKADAKFETIEPIVEDAVTYGAQSGKTDAQKAQARTNIGAGTYSKPSGGIPASDLAESYYLASNPSGYTNNQGTVTSVGAGAGLSISGTATVNPTVNVASDRKLLTTTEYNTINTNIGTAQSTADGAVEDAAAAQQKADDAYALAEGRENATSYANYQAMVAALNAESSAALKVGDNIYVETVGVPDLWVSDVLDSKASYTYTTDQAIVDALNNPSIGYVNIGWYRLSELETAKVDLSDYVEKRTTVTGTGALGGGGALSENITITHNAGSAPNVASGLYKISTDAYSHVSGATPVQTSDLAPLLNDLYLTKSNPTGTGALSFNRKSGTTVGTNSVAMGTEGEASGTAAQAFGYNTTAIGNYSHAEGFGSPNDSFYLTGSGTSYTYSVTQQSMRVGDIVSYAGLTAVVTSVTISNVNSGSIVVSSTLGTLSNKKVHVLQGVAHGSSSHVEGEYNNAIGNGAHAEGWQTRAYGSRAHAEGGVTDAIGDFSHSEGRSTSASGQYSHAEGGYTIANHKAQHVFGEFNEEDTSTAASTDRGNYVEIVGNGTSTTRSNARTLDWNGNEVLKGTSTAAGFKTPNGTSSGFLKADGSVDTTAYTANAGTVTSVGAGTGLSISGTASTNPTVNIASGYKLPTTTEYNALATKTYVDNAVGAIDQKQSFTFTATDARWSSTLVDGVYTLTFNASNTTGFVAGKIPLSCFNGDNEQVMATLGFTSTTVYIKSDTKFAGTIYVI